MFRTGFRLVGGGGGECLQADGAVLEVHGFGQEVYADGGLRVTCDEWRVTCDVQLAAVPDTCYRISRT